MNELVELARLSVQTLVKTSDDDAAVGRTPTNDAMASAGPAVPSEHPVDSDNPADNGRSSQDIIKDAIEVLVEGLQAEKSMLAYADKREVDTAILFLNKGDIPISVKAIVKDDKGRVLVLRDAGSSYWDLPGGHVRDGESISDALSREVQEETGLSVRSSNQTETRILDLGGQTKPVLFFDAECEGIPRCSTEHVGYQWADENDLNGLNLGAFKDILIPGNQSSEILTVGDPAASRKSVGPTQIPRTKVLSQPVEKEGDGGGGEGIAGAGDASVAEDSFVDTHGSGKKRTLKALVDSDTFEIFLGLLSKVSTGGGQFITGDDIEGPVPAEEKVEIPIGNETVKERVASVLDSAKEIGGIKLMKALDSSMLSSTDMRILSKTPKGPVILAGYASPVVVDQEGHRISHEALEKDLPRFMGVDG